MIILSAMFQAKPGMDTLAPIRWTQISQRPEPRQGTSKSLGNGWFNEAIHGMLMGLGYSWDVSMEMNQSWK